MSAPRFQWPDGSRCACVVSFDVDAESAILQVDAKYATHATTMTHQAYGPRVGVPRLLEQLRRADIRATFFVPGFTADCYPDTIRRIVADGHEIGWHGYMHELPGDLPRDEQRAIIERAAEVLEPLTGTRPVGYRAPWWQLSLESPELLAAAGFRYDSSLMDDDVPYLLGADAGTLVELPVHWSFDDWEQYGFFVDPPLGDSLERAGQAARDLAGRARGLPGGGLPAGPHHAPVPVRAPGAVTDDRPVRDVCPRAGRRVVRDRGRGRRARPRRSGRLWGPAAALGARSRLRDARRHRYLSRRESRRSLSSLPSV